MRSVPGTLWIAAGAALWGTDTVLRRPLVGVLSPTQLVFYEHLILSFVVLPIIVSRRSFLPKISRKTWLAICGISWVGSALALIMFTHAVRIGNPTTAVLLQKTQPLIAIILARYALGERWHRAFPIAAGSAVIGSFLISFGGNLQAPWTSVDVTAAGFAMGAAAAWATATVLGRFVVRQVPFELVTALRIVCALPVLAVVQTEFVTPQPTHLAPLVMLALIPGFVALMLYYRGLHTTSAAQASIAELAFPASAALLNWIYFGVTANPLQIGGFAIVWVSIFYLSQKMNFKAN